MQGGYCALGIDKTSKDIDMMIFGDSVMRNYFVAYDKKNDRIGFSQFNFVFMKYFLRPNIPGN